MRLKLHLKFTPCIAGAEKLLCRLHSLLLFDQQTAPSRPSSLHDSHYAIIVLAVSPGKLVHLDLSVNGEVAWIQKLSRIDEWT
jgi:hypothetical protein